MTVLPKNIAHGLVWSAVDVFFRQGVQFAVLILMARLLAPEDFGVIALLAVFVGVATIFIDGGFSSALIQKQNTTRVDESTVFYFNLAMAVLVSLLLCAVAPWIAAIFEKPILRYLSYAMALNLFVNAFGSIHTALLTKELNFKIIAKVGAVSSFVSGSLAIVLALQGFGVWSLAAQALASGLLSTLLLWLWHAWRPAWSFSFASLRSFFRFGGYLMIIGIVDVLHTNLYSVLIGKYYSVRAVGFYDRAQKTQLLPVNLLMLIINRVAFSAFSAAAEDKERLARGLRKAQRLIMFVNIPLSVIMIVLAEPIVVTLFGEKWLPSAPILRVLGFESLLWPIHVLNINVLKAQGRSDLFFNIMLIKKTLAISLIVAGSFYGIIAIAWAQVTASFFSFVVNAYYSKVFLNYGAIKQLGDLFPNLVAALPMGLTMWLVSDALHWPYYLELLLVISSGGVVYLLVSYWLRLAALREIIGLLPWQNKPMLTPDEI
ncbi:lipopolysaccharide biosynthesis protein [Methylomicrobium sp. Wu6]|uniref:lipopolysaccharide biosynthesis protein n=1 Tax=Methylomicrobium sp. Wu6 TaxID=3107928 RepID=UPI002DD6A56C|nr:lipopolysaccharide biosynthesis protein [Methylomicrobium sp. Wu6]MEC4747373.1 lipopolysaccharide biosynthesis protein [Methylomicrobium sp. Wu6]